MEKSNIENHLGLLGKKAKDSVTGFTGIVSTVSFDLYGCIQAILTPPVTNGVIDQGHYFDVTRLVIIDEKPVMPLPNFDKGYVAQGKKGADTMKPLK